MGAILEGSYATIVMYKMAQYMDPVAGLLNAVIIGYYVFIISSTLSLNFYVSLLTGLSSAFSNLIFSLDYIAKHQAVLPDSSTFQVPSQIFRVLLMVFVAFLSAAVARRIRLELLNTLKQIWQRKKIEGMFSSYVSKDVAKDLILDQKKANKGYQKEVTVMFLDIRNFTKFSEKKNPSEVFKTFCAVLKEVVG